MKQNIELHIEELVLHGFSHSDHHRIGGVIEQELTKLIIKGSILKDFNQDVQIPYLNGGSFPIRSDTKAESAGVEIARSVYRTINKT